MALPALDLLVQAGYRPVIVGRGWAASLLAAYPFDHLALPAGWRARVRSLRDLRRPNPATADQQGAARLAPGLLLTNSFSSALEFRAAGLQPVGYARDGRGLLLHRAVPVPSSWAGSMHTVDYYLALARHYLNQAAVTTPVTPSLQLTSQARQQAGLALSRAGITAAPVLLCPVAQGLHHGRNKCWAGFGDLARRLRADGHEVILCPGPGETGAARAAVPDAIDVGPLDVGAFAALLSMCRLVVANDSGPGHLAAAVNAPLLVIFGVTEPEKTCPRGPSVARCGALDAWPSGDEVWAAVHSLLGGS